MSESRAIDANAHVCRLHVDARVRCVQLVLAGERIVDDHDATRNSNNGSNNDADAEVDKLVLEMSALRACNYSESTALTSAQTVCVAHT
jgi:hypothetical protein